MTMTSLLIDTTIPGTNLRMMCSNFVKCIILIMNTGYNWGACWRTYWGACWRAYWRFRMRYNRRTSRRTYWGPCWRTYSRFCNGCNRRSCQRTYWGPCQVPTCYASCAAYILPWKISPTSEGHGTDEIYLSRP